MSIHYTEKDQIGFLTLDQDNSKANILNGETLSRLRELLDEIKTKTSIKVLIIRSAKPNIFIAGADISEIERITDIQDGAAKAKAGQDIMNAVEDLPFPTIAVMDGMALGGGCEFALACTYRVGTFNDKAKIGLPEVNLGFVPGFGGTVRLPRVVGLQQALTMILAGQLLPFEKALKVGLIDRLYPQKGLEAQVLLFAQTVIDAGSREKMFPVRKKALVGKFLEDTGLGRKIVFEQAKKSVLSKTKGFYPAPLRAVDLIASNISTPREQALALEARTFAELAVTDISKNLVHVFHITEAYRKLVVPGTEDIKPANVEKVGVLGAGIMGGGIAQLMSYKGIWVRLKDLNFGAIGLGLKSARKVFDGLVKKRKLQPSEVDMMMARISGTVDYTGFHNADMVIEAVVENMDIKKKVLKELSDHLPSQTIVATNTSSLSVTEMGSVIKDPSRMIGFHFFNPVHRMPLIEIITTEHTSKETIATAVALAKRLGKTPIVVKDACGFVVNRILLGYINEAGRILEQGGSLEHIDRIVTGFGMPMGPFTLSDEVGLDVGVKVMHILQDAFGDRFKPVPLFERVLEMKLLGKKTGQGFYVHSAKNRSVNTQVSGMVPSEATVGDTEALERMMYFMINEAARCLEDGVVDDPAAIDVGMIMGTGFPPFRGGLLRYADTIGIAEVVTRLQAFEDRFKDGRFKPCAYLEKLNVEKRGFYSGV